MQLLEHFTLASKDSYSSVRGCCRRLRRSTVPCRIATEAATKYPALAQKLGVKLLSRTSQSSSDGFAINVACFCRRNTFNHI